MAFQRSFVDGDEFVSEIVTGRRPTTLSTVADSRGPISEFGFRPPALNNLGDVAFQATLDDGSSGVFTGPDPVADSVIRTGDTIDGDPVSNVVFCEEGLNDSDQLTFVATLDDADAPEGVRVVVVRATPTTG